MIKVGAAHSADVDAYQQHRGISLLSGWLPITIEAVAIILLIAVLLRRSRRWWFVWLPVSLACGAVTAWSAYRWFSSAGLASDPAPTTLWWWIGAAGIAAAALVVGFVGAGWWRRVVGVLAVVATALAIGVVLDQWVGYFPTVEVAWAQLTAGPLTGQTDLTALPAMRGHPMAHGVVVPVSIPDTTSHFAHRTEYVYLPPAWFAGATPPPLPALMVIAGEFNTPADWIRIGNIVPIVDAYAAAHHGAAPILVFPDVGGRFNNDTECVDGPRGAVADHLTDEVRPFTVDTFHAAASPDAWGVVGWSMGGTCAVDLVTMHPDLFHTFDDIAGDAAPASGDRAQTIDRLFGGSVAAYDSYDPTVVMRRHGAYQGVHGVFDETSTSGRHRWAQGSHRPRPDHGTGDGTGGSDNTHISPGSELAAAADLCTRGREVGIDCRIHTLSGGHTWQFAAQAFHEDLGVVAADVGLTTATT